MNEFEYGAIIIDHENNTYTVRAIEEDEEPEIVFDQMKKEIIVGESIYLMHVDIYTNNFSGHFKV